MNALRHTRFWDKFILATNISTVCCIVINLLLLLLFRADVWKANQRGESCSSKFLEESKNILWWKIKLHFVNKSIICFSPCHKSTNCYFLHKTISFGLNIHYITSFMITVSTQDIIYSLKSYSKIREFFFLKTIEADLDNKGFYCTR